jgi:hypothetical protein
MEINPKFDDIRPFYDEEIPAAIEKLLNDVEFKRVVNLILPDRDWNELSALMRTLKSKRDFQLNLIKDIVYELVERSADRPEVSGFENINSSQAYTFITNHRDIVLDAAILDVTLADQGFDIPEIAIGDNLLLHPWIENLVRINRSFIVKRGVSFREMLETSKHLSQYIHFTIKEKNQSIWIAQREGRAKDSNDRTQESLLKMLAMGGTGGSRNNIRDLNICPVSLSYEYDPCDYLKAKEFQMKRDTPDFKKSRADDLLNMETGIFGFKGRIHFQIAEPINSVLDTEVLSGEKNEQIRQVAEIIDKEIFMNYKFYPVNYIAFDRLWKTNHFENKYTQEDLLKFDSYLQQQLDKIDLPQKDFSFLTEKILEMYSNPVKNFLSVSSS